MNRYTSDEVILSIDPLDGEIYISGDVSYFPGNRSERNSIALDALGSVTRAPGMVVDGASLAASSASDERLRYQAYRSLVALKIRADEKAAAAAAAAATKAAAGLVEQGYVDASIARGQTDVRLPWIQKGDEMEGYPDGETDAPEVR